MNYWYELKTWDDKSFWLEPERGRSAIALYEQRHDVSLGEAGAVAYKNIRSIVETDKAYQPHAAALPAGKASKKAEPVRAEAPNTVLFVYIKRRLTRKDFETGKYALLPHCWILGEDEGDVWVARTFPLVTGGGVPEGFEQCTSEESDRIDHMRAR